MLGLGCTYDCIKSACLTQDDMPKMRMCCRMGTERLQLPRPGRHLPRIWRRPRSSRPMEVLTLSCSVRTVTAIAGGEV